MPRLKIDQSYYDALVAAFRVEETPYKAAKLAGVVRRTAQKAWDHGWPERGFEPIRVLFEREKQEARVKMAALDQARSRREKLEAQQKALEQAADARAQEGQVVELSRATALQAVAIGAQLVQGGRALSGHIDQRIQRLATLTEKDPGYLGLEEALRILRSIGGMLDKISSYAFRTVQLERLVLGEPQLPAETITTQTEMTVEEATIRLEAGLKVLEDVKKHGGLTVIDGGLKEPVIGQKVEAG